MIATIARIATVVLMVAYPFVVYFGLTRFSTRQVAVVLVVLALVLGLSRTRQWSVAALRSAVVPLLPTVAASVIAGVTAEGWALLAVPVVVNVGLLITFGATLRFGRTPMIERFARLQEPELDAPKQAHCRQVTWAWIGFFAANAVVSAVLAIAAPFAWWAAWCGGLAYGAIGAMLAGEWCLRRLRFGPGRDRDASVRR